MVQEASSPHDQPLSLVHTGGQPYPHNHEAEMAVLGSIMLDPLHAFEVAFGRLNFEHSFHKREHQLIFQAIRDLLGQSNRTALDLVTLADALGKAGDLEAAGGRAYLAEILDAVPTAANVEQYVDIVHGTAVLRRLIVTCVETANRCFEAREDVRSLVDRVEQDIFQVTGLSERTDLRTISDLMMPALDHLEKLQRGEKEVLGLPTGYEDLDRLVTGLRPGEMFVIAARPSIGKTALALNMAANVVLRDLRAPVGIFSLEMPAEQIVLRMLCSEARIGMPEIREGAMTHGRWNELIGASQRLKDATVVVDDTAAIDVLELRSKARRMKRDYDIQALFVDYLQLIQVSGSNRNASRENEVARISGAIKALAKELRIPIVVLAQLNRMAEQDNKGPRLAHLRESGAIEQDADVVALLHRNRDDQQDPNKARRGVEAELLVAKNRNGETGMVRLLFFPVYTRFDSKSRIADEDVPDV
ncbi:MAG: replicative DNA helicase [Lentisphaeria bacterium]|nr:replicative DNA helicase [Lentisphaeria bacterium]